MRRHRSAARGAVVLMVLAMGGACGEGGTDGKEAAAPTPSVEPVEFCTLLAENDGEVDESYLGSAAHVASIDRLVTAAPAEIRPSFEVFRQYLRTSVDPTKPGSAARETYPESLIDAISRFSADRSDRC